MLRALILFLVLVPVVQAQDAFPSRPVRILVGFPAGGPSDIPARFIADRIRVPLGQPVIVENKTGAAGMIALRDVLAAPADGHTLLLCSYIDAVNTLLYTKAAYKVEDLAPVSLVQRAYYAFAIPADLPASTLPEFIRHARARPGELNYGTTGPGSVTDVLPRQLAKMTGLSLTGITFKGTGPAFQDLMAGRIHLVAGPLFGAIPLYQGKKVKLIGVTSAERLAIAPEVPTLSEQGTPLVSSGWWGVCARAGVPRTILDTLNRHVAAAVNSEEFRSAMGKTGVIAVASGVDEFGRILADTAKEARDLYRELGIGPVD